MGAGELHSYVYATGSFTLYSRQFGWLSPSLGISTCSVAMSAPVSYNVGYRRFSASDRPRPTRWYREQVSDAVLGGRVENGREVRVRGHHEGFRISGSGDDGESVYGVGDHRTFRQVQRPKIAGDVPFGGKAGGDAVTAVSIGRALSRRSPTRIVSARWVSSNVAPMPICTLGISA